jgi:hypothetical protein
LPQMHEMPSRRSMKKDRSDRSAEGSQLDQPTERDQPGRSAERSQLDQPTERGQPDLTTEGGQPDRTAGGDQLPPTERDKLDRPRKGYPSIQDEVQFHSIQNDLRSTLLLRLHELTALLRVEQDLDKLKRLLDCLEALLRVLKSLPE